MATEHFPGRPRERARVGGLDPIALDPILGLFEQFFPPRPAVRGEAEFVSIGLQYSGVGQLAVGSKPLVVYGQLVTPDAEAE